MAARDEFEDELCEIISDRDLQQFLQKFAERDWSDHAMQNFICDAATFGAFDILRHLIEEYDVDYQTEIRGRRVIDRFLCGAVVRLEHELIPTAFRLGANPAAGWIAFEGCDTIYCSHDQDHPGCTGRCQQVRQLLDAA
jgi:hypothetical protein